jgi:hypothetical protein
MVGQRKGRATKNRWRSARKCITVIPRRAPARTRNDGVRIFVASWLAMTESPFGLFSSSRKAGTHSHRCWRWMESWPQLCTTWTLVVMGPGSRFACPGRRRVRCPLKQFQTRLRDPAARCARVVHLSSAPKRAWGMPGARCTRSPLCNVESTGVEATGTPESPGIPARNGFNGLCRALLGDRALLPPSPTDM